MAIKLESWDSNDPHACVTYDKCAVPECSSDGHYSCRGCTARNINYVPNPGWMTTVVGDLTTIFY